MYSVTQPSQITSMGGRKRETLLAPSRRRLSEGQAHCAVSASFWAMKQHLETDATYLLLLRRLRI